MAGGFLNALAQKHTPAWKGLVRDKSSKHKLAINGINENLKKSATCFDGAPIAVRLHGGASLDFHPFFLANALARQENRNRPDSPLFKGIPGLATFR